MKLASLALALMCLTSCTFSYQKIDACDIEERSARSNDRPNIYVPVFTH